MPFIIGSDLGRRRQVGGRRRRVARQPLRPLRQLLPEASRRRRLQVLTEKEVGTTNG